MHSHPSPVLSCSMRSQPAMQPRTCRDPNHLGLALSSLRGDHPRDHSPQLVVHFLWDGDFQRVLQSPLPHARIGALLRRAHVGATARNLAGRVDSDSSGPVSVSGSRSAGGGDVSPSTSTAAAGSDCSWAASAGASAWGGASEATDTPSAPTAPWPSAGAASGAAAGVTSSSGKSTNSFFASISLIWASLLMSIRQPVNLAASRAF